MTTILGEQLAISRLKAPAPPARRLLVYIHSGESMRHFLPRLLRIGALVWLAFYVLAWLYTWPLMYEGLERWGLVKAYFAQMISLAASILVVRITFLRTSHLEALPSDDFVVLRATAVICRWLAEVAVVFVFGTMLALFLQPINSFALWLSPPEGGLLGLAWATVWFLVVSIAVVGVIPFFLSLYALATAIDLGMAIEFNTRAERQEKVSL